MRRGFLHLPPPPPPETQRCRHRRGPPPSTLRPQYTVPRTPNPERLEVRHESFLVPEFGSYGDQALDDWAGRIDAWSAGGEPPDPDRITGGAPPAAGARDVYVYFDKDEKRKAPFDARRLMERLEVAEGYPRPGAAEAMPE